MPKRPHALLIGVCLLLAGFLASPPGVAQLLTPDAARATSLQQYRLDLVRVLALRADATNLMAAALLSRQLADPPENLQYDSLIERASQADDAGATLAWARLAECRNRYACPTPESVAALTALAPDNAAVWLLQLGASYRAGDTQAALEALHRATTAKSYDDYAGRIRQALAEAVTSLPVPADVVAAYAAGSEAGPASAQLFLATSTAAQRPRPRFASLVQLCDPDQEHPEASGWRGDCLAVANILAWGSSPQARATGLHLLDVLAENPTQRQQAQEKYANLVWQVGHMGRLRLQAFSDGNLARELLRLARQGDREMSMIYAALRGQGIALSAAAADHGIDAKPATSGSTAPTTD